MRDPATKGPATGETDVSGDRPGGDRLSRELGFAQITASGVGIIVGAGIYVLLGAATGLAGSGVWMSFLGAGALSALTAVSYAELAAMYPAAGAEYDYVRRVGPPWLSFLVGWLMVVGLVVAAAAVSLGFARYLRMFVAVPERLGALGLLLAVSLVALRGIRRSVSLTVVLSLLQVGGLLAVIAVGIPSLGDRSLLHGASVDGVLGGAALVFFAFVGFDEVITLAEETRDPTRTVPRALWTALGISTLLYVAVAVAAVSVLGPDRLAASRQPLADVMARAIGGVSDQVVGVVALAATTNTTLLAVTAASRLQFGMASTRALPAAVGRLNRHQVPWRAVCLVAAVAAGFVAAGDVAAVAAVTDFAVYAVFLAVNTTVILLRFRQPNRLRPFRAPGSVGRVPVLPVLANLAVLAMLPQLAWRAVLTGGVISILGLAVHAALTRRADRPGGGGAGTPIRVVATGAVTAELPPAPGAGADPSVNEDGPVRYRRRVSESEAAAVASALGIDFAAVRWTLGEFHRGLISELAHGRADPDTNVTDDDLVLTGKIALAHLNEIPDYYTRLDQMESRARQAWADRNVDTGRADPS